MKLVAVVIIFNILKGVVLLSFHINKDGLEILYNITDISKCQVGGDRIRRKFGLSLPDCVEECVLRPRCKTLCYWRRSQICDLYPTFQPNFSTGDCIRVSVTNISVMKMPCDSCASGKFCEQLSKTCTYSECPSQSIDTVVVLGNVNAVGSKIRYRCAAGYDFTGGERYSVCKPDGQWNATASCTPQRADCGPPPAIPNGVALLSNPNGTLSGDTATIMCNDWYQSKVTTISCSDLGVWQTATCADCYLTTSRAYSGLTAKTITGKTCLRWDASYNPHSPFMDPGLFPESTLQQANNYCRNPDTAEHEPWCYIDYLTNWEYCDIKECI